LGFSVLLFSYAKPFCHRPANAKKLPSETRPDALDLLAEGMKLYHEQCQYIQSMHEGSNESAATFPAQTLPGGGTMIRTDINGK
jgi:hypothetical protein